MCGPGQHGLYLNVNPAAPVSILETGLSTSHPSLWVPVFLPPPLP